MKSILISVQPIWCEPIANRKKPLEIRKTKPKIPTPFKCYIYCTNSQRQYLRKIEIPYQVFLTENKDILGKTEKVKQILGDVTTFAVGGGYNGKVIGEFVCDYICTFEYKAGGFLVNGDIATTQNAQAMSCLSDYEFRRYAKEKTVYGWHISDLVIYDKPKVLSEFTKYSETDIRPCQLGKGCEYDGYDYSENCEICTIDYDGEKCPYIRMQRPPQSWCYVEEIKNDK